jgi:S-(hydroxymethyl)glutathione dehydrogenase/alcohol dehydrogenase
MKSQAAVLWEVGQKYEIEDVELDAPQPGEVRVKIAAAGLCHTDDHVPKGDLQIALPIIGGHEGAGVVEEVGAGVTRLKPGDHVVLVFMPSCGHCRWCAQGMAVLCDLGAGTQLSMPIADGKPRAHARGKDLGQMTFLGTFAPYAVVHQDSCVKIDDDLPLDLAALVGCGVATGWGAAVNRAQVEPGDTVVVVGTGGVGVNAVQGALNAGAETVVAVDPFEFRRESAKLLGATHSAASMEEAFPLVQELTRGVMADRVICTASLMTGEMLQPMLNLTRKGGRIVLTSVANTSINTATLSLADLTFSQKEIVGNTFGGCNAQADLPKLLSLYRKGHLKLDELVTKRYTLEQVNEGYDDLLAGRTIRGLIDFSL